MSAVARAQGLQSVPGPRLAKLPGDLAWHAWVAKGRVQTRRRNSTRAKAANWAANWAAIAGLLTAAGLWSHLPPYELAVRCIVAAGAMVVMVQAVRARHYAIAAAFGGLVLLYNPVAPAFEFSGAWQRSVVLASAIPFVASLVWRTGKLVRID